VLEVDLRNNLRARVMQPDGGYVRRAPGPADPEIDSQAWLLAHPAAGGHGAAFSP